MESYGELYQLRSIRTEDTPAGERGRWFSAPFLSLRQPQTMTEIRYTEVLSNWGLMLTRDTTRYRHAGSYPHRLIFGGDRTDLCSLWVRERKGMKANAERWRAAAFAGDYDSPLRDVVGGHDWMMVRVSERMERRVEVNAQLRAVAWLPVHVLYYGVKLEELHELQDDRIGVHVYKSYHWSHRRTEAAPNVFLWRPSWAGDTKPGFLRTEGLAGVRDSWTPELRGDDWKDHCEVRHAAAWARVCVKMVNRVTTTHADNYHLLYPAVFLGETNSRVGVVVRTDARDPERLEGMVPRAEARAALDLLEHERVRRGVLFSDLAAAVFHPARLERMMTAYGEDWMERV
jgi:hypothetical protein